MLKDDLEIILITYNRKPYLERTLRQLFDENSPIKDFQITILDNCSDDGSSELTEEYCNNYKNIKHIVHSRNIGGCANVTRAFEIAKKKYVWVICDDDYYNWENWHYVEQAVGENHDAVIVANHNINNSSDIYEIIFQSTFLPAGIYKTSLIDNDVMRNAYDNIQNMFPHLAISTKIANTTKDFYVIPKAVVLNGYALDKKNKSQADDSFTRGNVKSEISPVSSNMWFYVGYVNSLVMMKEKNAVTKGLKTAVAYKPSEQSMTSVMAKIVKISLKNPKSSNLFWDVFCRLDFSHKCLLMLFKILPIYFFTNPKGIHVQILNCATIRLIPFRLKQQLI